MPRLRPYITPILISLLLVWIFIWKLHTWHEPLERDITTYSLFATEMLHGRSLYADLWDHKPPAIFITYAAVQALFGQTLFSIFLLWLIPALLIFAGVIVAGRALHGRMHAGLWAAALWAFSCGSLPLQANQPNTENFINALLLAAFILLLNWREEKMFWWRHLGIGVLFAIASLYKQVVVAVPAVISIAMLIHSFFATNRQYLLRRTLFAIFCWFFCGIVLWGLLFGYMQLTGRFGIFVDTVFRYSPAYAGSLTHNLLHAFSPEVLFAPHTFFFWPMAAVGFTGFVIHLTRRRLNWRWLLWLAYLIGSRLAMALPGKYFPHYFQLELPALIIGAAWAVDELSFCACMHGRVMSMAMGLVALVLPVVSAMQSLTLTPEEWSERKYGPLFVQSKAMGQVIERYLQPGETFALFGEESGIYWYSHRRPPSGILYINQMSEGPFAGMLAARAVQEVSRANPRYLVALTWRLGDPQAESVYRQWVLSHYHPAGGNSQFGLFTVMVRNDLALLQSLWFYLVSADI